MDGLITQRDTVNNWMKRYGVRFGIYKNGEFKEQIFPFDPIPRKISASEWKFLEKGLVQRVKALNLFLADVYSQKQIIKENVVPEDFVFSSSGYLPFCEGIKPSKNIYSHISGIDLVHGKNDEWYILEDNLRIPSGASYPLIAREITRNVRRGRQPQLRQNAQKYDGLCENRRRHQRNPHPRTLQFGIF